MKAAMNATGDSDSLPGQIARLWRSLPKRRRTQFCLLTFIMVLTSLAEVFSIGAVLPFLGVLIDPQVVFNQRHAQPIIALLGIRSPQELLLPLTVIFASAALIAGTMRLLLLYLSTRLSFAAGADLSIETYRRTLYQPYSVHVAWNSSEIISGITGKTSTVIYAVLMPLVNLIGSLFLLCVIMVALVAVDPRVALAALIGFGLIYVLVIALTRRQLIVNSIHIARESEHVLKALQEGLGGIRDVLLDGTQPTYCKIYQDADLLLRRAQGNNVFIGSSPRFATEALGMVLIAGLAYSLAKDSSALAGAIPVLGALALGAQRLLQVLQQCYAAWASIKGSQSSLEDTLSLLEQPAPEQFGLTDSPPLTFTRQFELSNISFRYHADAAQVLNGIKLQISKGERVGIMGTTGSGKSTLLDIVMGLLPPCSGQLVVDGKAVSAPLLRSWQKHIAHVPQSIYLADTSVAENIAFGCPKSQIDMARVKDAAQQAQIADMIETMPKKYETFVGERGVRLSGGQRQRIGIARALYKNADVIVFDEATSALDNETERAVMDAIGGLSTNLTILIIAHRLSTLQNCDRIVELESGQIRRIGSYQDMVLAPAS